VVQAQLALAVELRLLDVHVQAEGAAVHLRGADVHEVGEPRLDVAAPGDGHAEVLEFPYEVGRLRGEVKARLGVAHDRLLS
jgi:hypothetical protein